MHCTQEACSLHYTALFNGRTRCQHETQCSSSFLTDIVSTSSLKELCSLLVFVPPCKEFTSEPSSIRVRNVFHSAGYSSITKYRQSNALALPQRIILYVLSNYSYMPIWLRSLAHAIPETETDRYRGSFWQPFCIRQNLFRFMSRSDVLILPVAELMLGWSAQNGP